MRYFIYLSYIGKAYSGWQLQSNALSVQQLVEEALSRLLATKVAIWGSSRTDKGVHAKQQVAHFEAEDPLDLVNLIYRLNKVLPADITVSAIRPVVASAHSRFNAFYRIYEYSIVRHKNPFYRDTAVWLYHIPPLELLNQIAALFCIKADFEIFSKVAHQISTFVCDIKEAVWFQVGEKVVFRIKADRFLRGMVRIIVGTILKVGSGAMTFNALEQLILHKPVVPPVRTLVPPHGLTLVEVGYPETVFLKGYVS